MWLSNEDGFLMYVDKSEVQVCRYCGKKYKREISIMSYGSVTSNDECPNCGYVLSRSNQFKYNNMCLEGV